MKRLWMMAVLAAMLAGCAETRPRLAHSVTQCGPGFGVMVATFRYVPGQSAFEREQILVEAQYVADRLAAIGYQPFIVYCGGDDARVGIRTTTYAFAQSIKREIERTNHIDIKDGKNLAVHKCEIVNIAELQPGALDRFR